MIEPTTQYKIPLKDGTIPALNQRVRTPHGVGKIVGQDVPVGSWGSTERAVRYYVFMDRPTPDNEGVIKLFDGQKLCYWADELEPVKRKKA